MRRIGHISSVIRLEAENATAQDTKNEITGRDVFLPDGFYFATHQGTPIGTACAWRQFVDEKDVGYVHMVGVVAEHTGHKLGKWVSLAVLIYFRDNGFKCSMLDTDDFPCSCCQDLSEFRIRSCLR